MVFDGGDHAIIIPFIGIRDSFELEFGLDFKGACCRTVLGCHQSVALEFVEGHIREIVNSLFPGVIASIVLSDFLESFKEDFESIMGFGCIGAPELSIDFFGYFSVEFSISVKDIPIFEIQMQITRDKTHKDQPKYDF